MKKLIPFLCFLIPHLAFGTTFDQFLHGLQKDYLFLNKNRGSELSHHVRVAKFGLLGRVMGPDAIATYNGTLNLINLYQNAMKGFYKKNFPSFNPHTVFHEHFGYYRTDLIELMTNERDQILLNNGFNKYRKSCFLKMDLKMKLANGIPLSDFQKWFPSKEDIFDLSSAIHHTANIPQMHDLFWNYHQKQYHFPSTQKELVARMNDNSEFNKILADCREKFWKETHQ